MTSAQRPLRPQQRTGAAQASHEEVTPDDQQTTARGDADARGQVFGPDTGLRPASFEHA